MNSHKEERWRGRLPDMELLPPQPKQNQLFKKSVRKVIFINQTQRPEKKEPFMPITCGLLRFLCRVNLLPYEWDKEGCRLRKRENHKVYYYLWIFTTCVWSWALFLFQLVRFVQSVGFHWKSLKRKRLGSIIGIWSGLGFQFLVSLNTKEILTHLEMIMTLSNRIISFRKRAKDPALRRDFGAARIMTLLFILRNVQLIVTGCLKPNRPQFIYSVIPPQYKNPFTFTLYVILTVYSSLCTWLIMYGTFTMIGFVQTLKYMLKQKFPPTVSPRIKLLHYKIAQILVTQFNHCMSTALPKFLRLYIVLMSITCSFGCIRFVDKLDARVYITMPITIVTAMAFGSLWYGTAGQIPSLSSKAAKRMFVSRDERDRAVLLECRCSLRACRTISVNRIKRFTWSTMVKIICIQTIRLLLVTSRK